MDDLVKRLREWWEYDTGHLISESASRIEAAQSEIARLQAEVAYEKHKFAESEKVWIRTVTTAHNTAWNDAIEAAALELEHHHSEESDSTLCDIWQERIRALKRPTGGTT